MTVHLLKLAAGVKDFAQVKQRFIDKAVVDPSFGRLVPVFTRNTPKQSKELLDGGSLYWVAGGQIVGRTAIVDIREDHDEEGRKYCLLCVSPDLIRVRSAPKRAFQGWRYLKDSDTPEDIENDRTDYSNAPPEMLDELQKLGLI